MIPANYKKIIIISIIFVLINSSIVSVSAVFNYNIQKKNIDSSLDPGDYNQHILINGRLRSYRLHIPPSYEDETPMPLVLVLHGSGVGANSLSMKIYSEMDKKGDKEGFIVVYPNGELLRLSRYLNHPIARLLDLYYLIRASREWNRWDDNNVDDVGYIRDLIKHLELNLNVNSSRIYITGFSGGAMMTYRLGAELSDQIAAIAPVAGSIGGLGFETEKNDTLPPYIISKPINPIPVITFHGIQDKSVPYEGGWKQVFNWTSYELWVYIVSVNESITFWTENNKCDPVPEIKKSESGRIITKTYSNGIDNSDVVLVTYVDGGHEWFKSPPHELSAVDLLWEFFEQHPKS
jgi:polyhydroxybutyrate depolymerase